MLRSISLEGILFSIRIIMITKLLFGPTTCSRGCGGGGGGGMMITMAWSSATSSRSIRCFTIRSTWMSSKSNAAAVAQQQLQWMYHHRRWFSSYSDYDNKSSSPLLQNMAYIAVGSNMGDRFRNIHQALELLSSPSSDIHRVLDLLPSKPSSEEELEDNDDQIEVQVTRTSFLYETQPMYFVDQPPFLNGAIQIYTNLSPLQLLRKCKLVEQILGREDTVVPMKGPRPIDLDLLLYYDNYKNSNSPISIQHGDHELIIPHPRMAEREFVLQPMVELDPFAIIPDDNNNNTTVLEALQEVKKEQEQLDKEENACVRVLPLPRNRVLTFGRYQTIIMGILNVTPDSFSDGGKLQGSVDRAVQEALQMVTDGATIIDVGGESTRPGAQEVDVEEELRRTIPVIKALRHHSHCNHQDIIISIDTRRSIVAQAAVEAGADIVNDVSGGTYDANMWSTVSSLQVPYIMMHMRGTPETMKHYCYYDPDVVTHVAQSLAQRSRMASEAAEGIRLWLQVLDPGIGFAKDVDSDLSLIKHLPGKFRQLLQHDYPLLVGLSRKSFIGHVTGETNPSERDYGTAAACAAALLVGAAEAGPSHINNNNGVVFFTTHPTIIRIHNVKGLRQAIQVIDAINRTK